MGWISVTCTTKSIFLNGTKTDGDSSTNELIPANFLLIMKCGRMYIGEVGIVASLPHLKARSNFTGQIRCQYLIALVPEGGHGSVDNLLMGALAAPEQMSSCFHFIAEGTRCAAVLPMPGYIRAEG